MIMCACWHAARLHLTGSACAPEKSASTRGFLFWPFFRVSEPRDLKSHCKSAHAGSICVGALLPGPATSLRMMRPKAHAAAFSF